MPRLNLQLMKPIILIEEISLKMWQAIYGDKCTVNIKTYITVTTKPCRGGRQGFGELDQIKP